MRYLSVRFGNVIGSRGSMLPPFQRLIGEGRPIAMAGKNIEIVFTGLRQGEKLHEVLVGSQETLERPFHSKVSRTKADVITPERLDQAGWEARMMSAPLSNDT